MKTYKYMAYSTENPESSKHSYRYGEFAVEADSKVEADYEAKRDATRWAANSGRRVVALVLKSVIN